MHGAGCCSQPSHLPSSGSSSKCRCSSLQGCSLGMQVGLLDIDICGPSIPKMLGLEGEEIHSSASGWSPVYVNDKLGVMSIGFLLPDKDDAVIWRGPRKNGLIKQFLKVGSLSLSLSLPPSPSLSLSLFQALSPPPSLSLSLSLSLPIFRLVQGSIRMF